ncbi:hypothetical protein SCALM49S_00985 [Streptomyces californicus]
MGSGVRAPLRRAPSVTDSLGHWRDIIGAPVYCAVYCDGEIELIAVAEGARHPGGGGVGLVARKTPTPTPSGSACSPSSTSGPRRPSSTVTPYGPSPVTQCKIAPHFWNGCAPSDEVNRSSNARSTRWDVATIRS